MKNETTDGKREPSGEKPSGISSNDRQRLIDATLKNRPLAGGCSNCLQFFETCQRGSELWL